MPGLGGVEKECVVDTVITVRTRKARPAAVAWVGALALACLAVIVFNGPLRGEEASAAAWWLTRLLGLHPTVSGSAVLVAMDGRTLPLPVTVECAASTLVIPVLILGAVLALGESAPLRSIAVATGISVLVVLVACQLRIAAVLATTMEWGFDPGYSLGRLLTGSLVTLAGYVVALAFLLGRSRR
ncbi:hypothetical protein Lxx21090 [Leifsonia xyli subsp. xyli str. CTCB07]|uniref:Exosortase/archaeosortase family protein n=1 Tax=Leifsonia xyli subsp. xyli (strain CTCB07) TaxID=281090 RepID=Q6ACT5_LEIXX|nr:hypothetical protein Lxx21090 [Leifsonia xyli subsp. xyli str. CTCB07]